MFAECVGVNNPQEFVFADHGVGNFELGRGGFNNLPVNIYVHAVNFDGVNGLHVN